MITGDHGVIAKETSRVLGMGTNIMGSQGLPVLGDGGSIPDDLVEKYGDLIIPADGFAQVCTFICHICVSSLESWLLAFECSYQY